MALASNPKTFARSIAEGYVPFTRASCKQFSSSELKSIYRNLELVMREYRGLVIPLEEIKALQYRNQVLQRANNALSMIRYFAKRHKIVL